MSPDTPTPDQPPAKRRRLARLRRRRVVVPTVLVVLVLLASYLIVGHQLFDRDHGDQLRHADAIVVLGGEHDGREQYGIDLARQGYADTVLLSNPYDSSWPNYDRDKTMMQHYCDSSTAKIKVICFVPNPSTTRGEAMYVQDMAKKYGWHTVIVVSWRFHLVRARYIFGQCFSGDVAMHSVPRVYPSGPVDWFTVYPYQYIALAKAWVLGCNDG